MFKVAFPHMVLNSHNLPLGEAKVRMWNTYDVPKDHPPAHILGWTASAARGAAGGKLETLVFNCHGFEDKEGHGGYGLDLGTGIFRADTARFSVLKGLVSQILMLSCSTADIARATGPGATVDGDGNLFCCEIAKASGSYVTASQNTVYGRMQSGIAGGLAYGCVPDLSGTVLTYAPAGNVVNVKKPGFFG